MRLSYNNHNVTRFITFSEPMDFEVALTPRWQRCQQWLPPSNNSMIIFHRRSPYHTQMDSQSFPPSTNHLTRSQAFGHLDFRGLCTHIRRCRAHRRSHSGGESPSRSVTSQCRAQNQWASSTVESDSLGDCSLILRGSASR